MEKSNCTALPEEIEELYKRGMTSKLMLDKIQRWGGGGKRISKKFTVCVSPSIHPQTKRCAFLNGANACSLINDGLRLHGCKQVLADENHEQEKINFEKRWLTDRAMAVIKFFAKLGLNPE